MGICLLAMLVACGGEKLQEETKQTEVGATNAPTTQTQGKMEDATGETTAATRPATQENGNEPETPTSTTAATTPVFTEPTIAPTTTSPTKPKQEETSPEVVTKPTQATEPTQATQPDPVVPETTVPEIEKDGYNSQIIRP